MSLLTLGVGAGANIENFILLGFNVGSMWTATGDQSTSWSAESDESTSWTPESDETTTWSSA